MKGRESIRTVISVNPFRCRMWALHDRVEEHITESSCREEIESFQRHGQLVPVLGRPRRGDPDYDVELIFGARRLFVARHLNMAVRIEIREMSDRQAIVAMDIENRQRKDISPYERGLSYARWLRDGHFSSQDDIADALKVSASQVSRLLKLSRLPPVILNAFESPAHICEAWGLELAAALEDPQRRDRTIRKAREIARESVKLPAATVFRALLAASASGRKAVPKQHDEVVLDDEGAPLFRIRHVRTSVALILPVGRVSARHLREISGAVRSLLCQETVEAVESTVGAEIAPLSG